MKSNKNQTIKAAAVLAVIVLVSSSLRAQPGWNLQSSSTLRNLQGVFFADSSFGITVGDSGTVLRTTNGGTSWNAESSATQKNLSAVAFANRDTGVAVGGHIVAGFAYAVIVRTTDGGIHWANLFGDSTTSPYGYLLHAVTFLNDSVIIAVGGNPIFFGEVFVILRSTDAGTTWQQPSFGETTSILAFSFADESHGMAVGTNKRTLTTSNGGASWSPLGGGGSTLSYRGIHYAPPLIILAGDSGIIFRSTDNGSTWSSFQNESVAAFTSIDFTTPFTGYIADTTGTILKTTDQGSSWQSLKNGIHRPLRNVSFVITNIGTAVGDSGTILHTTYGGNEADIHVTFRVHMGVQQFEKSFRPNLGDVLTLHSITDGFNNPVDTLTDPDNDSIYTVTLIRQSHQSMQFRFWKTLRNDIDSETIGMNRILSLGGLDTTLPVLYFSNISDYPTIVGYEAGWNMLSLPRLVADGSWMTLFPTATSGFFAFTGNAYIPLDTMKEGVGYWIRLPSTTEVIFSGTRLSTDTLDVVEGWNLIGTITDPVSTETSITSDPAAIVQSSFFEFSSGTYAVATFLQPGHAYWVKVNQAGKLIVKAGSQMNNQR